MQGGAGGAQVERLGEHEHGGNLLDGRRVAHDLLGLADVGAVDDGAVAAQALGQVEGLVGVADEILLGGAVRRERRDAEAHREAARAVGGQRLPGAARMTSATL